MIASWVLAAAVVAAINAAGWIPISRALKRRPMGRSLTLAMSASLTLGGAALWGTFSVLGLEFERHGWILWSVTGVAALVTGAVGAAKSRQVPTLELLLASAWACEVSVVALFVELPSPSLADPAVRGLFIGPLILVLGGYFGASLGYLLWGGSGNRDLEMGYESLVGRRFLLSKSSSVLSTVTTISVVGVTLGVWLVIVSLGVLSGFEHDLREKIIGTNAHLVLQQEGGRTFELEDGLLAKVAQSPGVLGVNPFVQGDVAVASRSNYTGALLYGIDPVVAPDVISVLQAPLFLGSLNPLINELLPSNPPKDAPGEGAEDEDAEFAAPKKLPSIVVGAEMKKSLNLKNGGKVRVISPLHDRMTPVGMVPASQGFVTAGVFSSKNYDFDARFAYVTLPAARRFLELGDRDISGLQIRVDDADSADRIGARIVAELGPKWESLDWKGRNQTLFAALKLERVVAFVVLVFIILVASFSIVNTLTMSVIEKQKEIAILKTMGARDVGIMKLFLVQGLMVGGFGTLIGTALALATVAALKTFGFWIPDDVYYIDSLPVHLEAADVVLVVLSALLIVWDFAVFPALRGSQLKPVEGLRDG